MAVPRKRHLRVARQGRDPIRIDTPEWMAEAACGHLAASGSDLAFPSSKARARRFARAFCDGCPVKLDCAEYAVSNGEEHGVWGGVYFTKGGVFQSV